MIAFESKECLFSHFSIIGNRSNFLWYKSFYNECFWIIFSYDNFFRIWNSIIKKKKTKRFLGHTAMILNSCGCKKSRVFISVSNDMAIKLWDPVSARVLRTLLLKFDRIRTVGFNIPYQAIVCIGKTSLTIWNSHNGQCIHCLFFSAPSIPSISFLGSSHIFFIAGKDRLFMTFDVKTGANLKNLKFTRSTKAVELHENEHVGIFCNNLFLFLKNENAEKQLLGFQTSKNLLKNATVKCYDFNAIFKTDFVYREPFAAIRKGNQTTTFDTETGFFIS